jgi:hypothetical protein
MRRAGAHAPGRPDKPVAADIVFATAVTSSADEIEWQEGGEDRERHLAAVVRNRR